MKVYVKARGLNQWDCFQSISNDNDANKLNDYTNLLHFQGEYVIFVICDCDI